MFETPCSFEPEYYQRVMLNLIRHPEISSTYLFRAEIFYDSFNDPEQKFVKHIKAEYQPRPCHVPGYELQQTIVRRMIPRNPQRDNPLVQTCHILKSREEESSAERNLVIYIPHVQSAEDVPFYHPTVAALAFLHTWPAKTADADKPQSLAGFGTFSIHYHLFPSHPLDNRLTRTALSLLTLINKHSLGQKAGYTKRVHHDQIIPQARFQDTYTRLKTKYAKSLIDNWVEQTPPGKHVFEDLGIAAFLLELWQDMYAAPTAPTPSPTAAKPPFPGFVDIGCGNGLLVHILRHEGYAGWGFDARRRKTWSTFPATTQTHLKELVLVPAPFGQGPLDAARAGPAFHAGVFPAGTFVVSNHADELTPWTPLLAALSRSPWLAIPCCSHNLAGARFRARVQVGGGGAGDLAAAGRAKGQQPSAYATLCDWVARLGVDVGFVVEREMLRIPSTRNAGILGRGWRGEGEGAEEGRMEERMEVVRKLLVREMGGSEDGEGEGGVEAVGREWVDRAGKLVRGQGGGH
ncbi:AdoMet-dependent methyltransferase predicted [Neofusicoccum parvum]|uniref:AdoMet-dependent methyltransferase predicted n=1 Tax=Neofusicoccum parvum TaxID=310453 RepID=A0ACB5SNG8_9PEZI|nr:AdoMet-dependent methyltransferase predicted [Neofusicoccum parvum]